MLIITRSGSTFYSDAGKRWSYESLHQLVVEGTSFKVHRHSDGKDITNQIHVRIREKVWVSDELDRLNENFGKLPIEQLQVQLLSSKTVGQIRHKAAQLKLTVDREWTDREVSALAALKRAGVPSDTISEVLQRPTRAVEVKASKLGLSHGGGSESGKNVAVAQISRFQDLGAREKGKIAEDMTSIALTQRSFDVFVPYTPNHQTDTIIVRGSRACKIQVKAAVWEKTSGRFRVPLRRKNPRTHKRQKYAATDIDFFALICLGFDDLYLVPYITCQEHTEAHLYPHRPKKIQVGFDWELYRNAYGLLDSWFSCDDSIHS